MTDPKQLAKDDWRVAGVGMSDDQLRAAFPLESDRKLYRETIAKLSGKRVKKPRTNNPDGRPVELDGGRPMNLYVSEPDRELLRELGGGKASEGLRVIAEFYRSRKR